jgi:hypothetical protein
MGGGRCVGGIRSEQLKNHLVTCRAFLNLAPSQRTIEVMCWQHGISRCRKPNSDNFVSTQGIDD